MRSTSPPSGVPVVSSVPPIEFEVAADVALVAAVLRKDRKATAELVSRHSGALYGYVRRRLAPRADLVDDLVQEIFLAVLKGLGAYAGQASLRSWILGIARRRVADHYRTTLRREEVPVGDDEQALGPTTAPHVDDVIDRARLQGKTRRMLARLPPAYAYALYGGIGMVAALERLHMRPEKPRKRSNGYSPGRGLGSNGAGRRPERQHPHGRRALLYATCARDGGRRW